MSLLIPDLIALAQDAGRFLSERGWRAATAESCTGGLIGAALTAVPGSSAWFDGGIVSYANSAKIKLLSVPPEMLEQFGAVSEQVAVAMANGAREKLEVELAVAVTGVAGPGGGSPNKPVGMVCIAWAGAGWQRVKTFYFSGDRDRIREQTVAAALRGMADEERDGAAPALMC